MIKRNTMIVMVMVVAFMLLWALNRQIRSRQQTLQTKISECNRLLQQVKAKQQHLLKTRESLDYLLQDLNEYEKWQNQQFSWSEMLQQTMSELPKTVWLEQMTAYCDPGNTRFQNMKYMDQQDLYNTTYDLTLFGKTTQRQAVGQFVSGLAHKSWLQDSAIAEVDRQNMYWRFKIQSTLK